MIDNSNIRIISHVWIRDPDQDVTFVKQRDDRQPSAENYFGTPLVHEEEIAPEGSDMINE